MLKTALVLCLAAVNCHALNGWPLRRSPFSPLDLSVQPLSHAITKPADSANSRKLSKLTSHIRGVIPYYETWRAVEETRNLVEEHIKIDEKPSYDDPNRHYLTILGVIQYIVEAIADTCQVDQDKYEQEYVMLVGTSLMKAWNDPEETADKIKQLIDVADQQTLEVRKIIEGLCGENTDSPLLCNMILTRILKDSSESYMQQTKLLLKLGKVANLFGKLTSDIEEVVDKHDKLSFFFNNTTKDLLEPFVLGTVEIILDLGLNSCVKKPVQAVPSRLLGKHIHHKGLHSLHKVPIISVHPDLGLKK